MCSSSDKIELIEAGGESAGFVRRLSRELFAQFGDYETLLPRTMAQPCMRTVVAREAGRPVGFAIFDLSEAAAGLIDLTAIAVEPSAQSRGVGRHLLDHVETRACSLVSALPRFITLTVAEGNLPARKLFARAGYRPLPGNEGCYAGGQKSMTLFKCLASREPGSRYPRG